MLAKILKFPVLKRVIPSILIRTLRLLKKNRGYFKVKGTLMYLDFLDPIDREIILYQQFEKLEVDFLIKVIQEHQISYFIDVGANCGYYSMQIANEINKITILSFEPNPEAYLKFSKTLEKNISLSNKIILKNYGLSNKSSKLKMQSLVKFGYPQTGGSSVIEGNQLHEHFVFLAKFENGDEKIKINNEKIAIKIDVEGYEINVLNGIKKILQNNKCILQIEIFNKNYDKVSDFLLKFGYRQFFEVKQRSNFFFKNFN